MSHAAYCFLRQLRQVVRSVSVDASKTSSPRVHLVAFRLLQLSSIRHLQRRLRLLQAVQNAAARLVTGSRRCDHITPVLQQLAYTGYQYDSAWNLSPLSWSTRLSTAWHQRIYQTIASSLPPDAVSYDHQTISSALSLVRVHVLEIEHSLLPDHAFGTVFLYTSVHLIFPWTRSAANRKRI